VADDWMPRFVDHAEDKYDEHAQAAMREAEAAVGDHGAQIQAPALFKMEAWKGDDGEHIKGGTGTGGSSAGGSSAGGSARGLHAAPVPVAPSAGPPIHDLPGLSGSDPDLSQNGGPGLPGDAGASGPVLSGITPVTGPPGAGLTNPGSGAGLGPPPGSGPGALGVVPVGGGLGVGGPGAVPGINGAPGTRRPVPVRRGLPSGAVIGEDSDRGLAGRGGGASGGSSMGAVPMGGGMAGGRGSGRRRDDGSIDGDADQQWATQQGVTPVIAPDDRQVRHDPGPGVIGMDR
jgi:hypothetical protein